MSVTQRPPPDLDGESRTGVDGSRSSARSGVLRTIFWNTRQQRARAVWLALLPVVGAYAALIAGEVVATEIGLPVQVGFALFSFAALVTVVALMGVSSRYLGARRIPDYGLAVDRRWRVDFAAGLVVGFVAVSIPFLFALALGWVEIGAVFDAGELALLPGFVAVGAGLLCVGVWEELAIRGVLLGNTADGLRRWLSPHRAIAVAVALSGLVFGLAHIAQPDYAPLILTWVFAGLVFGGMYVFSGSLALPIGAHITVNAAYQMVFVRTDYAGTESYSAVMRIVPDPALAFLQAGGVIDIGVYGTLGLLTYLWLRFSRGKITIDPVALQLAASEPRARRRTDDAVHRSRQ